MPLSIYDTATLVDVVRNLKTPSQFLLTTYFPNVVEYPGREIAVDIDVGKRRLAPFVSPLVEGKSVESRGISTNIFAPAYIKDKRGLDPLRPVMRAMGERIGGGTSPAEREMQNLAFEMEDQVQMVNRRLEWMAANALLYSTVTVSGDGYAPVTVNFQRDPALTVTLAGAAKWTPTNIGTPVSPGSVSPAQNIEAWAATVLQKSGAIVTDITFTLSAWNAFLQDPKVVDSVWFPRSGDSRIDFGGQIMTGAAFKGVWGLYRLWLYNDWYVADASTGGTLDTEYPMVPDYTVILGSKQMQGTLAFGAIIDPQFAYGALAYAPKSWVTEDPAQRWLMMQSAPLVIPSRVNAAMAVTVGP